MAAGLGIQHQGIARMPQPRPLQGDGAAVLRQGVGAVQVGQQAAGGPQGQRRLRQPQASQVGQTKAGQQGGAGRRRLEGGAGLVHQPQSRRAPGGLGFLARPDHLGGLQLQQLLVQPATALLFAEAQLAGADIGHRQAPAALLQHHGAQPVVAPCRQHPLFQHRPRRQHPGDVAAQQGPFGGGGFQLIAQGDAVAAPHQLGAVALGGVVGQARHRHPPQALAGILARQGQLQQARQQDRVLKEALKEVPQPVEQHPLWLGRLELHVVAQHRGQGGRIHQAVVVPAGQIRIGRGGVAVVLGQLPLRLPLRRCLRLPRRQLH